MRAFLTRAYAWGLGGLVVLGFAAQGGRFAPWLDLPSHFAPAGLMLGLAAGAMALAGRPRWRRAGLIGSGLAVLAWGLLIAPEHVRGTGPAAAPDARGQLKVIQVNALRDNADIERVAEWLVAQEPDIVTISEARHDLRDLLIRRAGWKTAGARSTLMIFTRERYLRMDRPQPAGAKTTFINATYASPAGPAEVVTTHLDWPTSPKSAGQARVIAAVVAQLPRERMILTGDFNATPWSARLRRLDRELGLIRRDRGVATWPAQVMGRPWPLPFLPIDHVYAGPGWATVKVERGPWLGSDHYPLVVTLAPVAPR